MNNYIRHKTEANVLENKRLEIQTDGIAHSQRQKKDTDWRAFNFRQMRGYFIAYLQSEIKHNGSIVKKKFKLDLV